MSRPAPRRAEILVAARHLIATHGYTQTSIRDIADAVGIMPASMYSHFRSKAVMVERIVGGFYDELLPAQRAALAEDGSGAECYRAMIGAVFDICADHREEVTILHYDWATLAALDELVDVKGQTQETLDLWTGVIRRGRKDGSILKSVDPQIMERVTTSAIHTVLDTVRFTDRPLVKASRTHLRRALQQTLLGGVVDPGYRSGTELA
ncbi:hypothetical protein BH10ACT3_BH10ACT3_07690 [soil metagenome]